MYEVNVSAPKFHFERKAKLKVGSGHDASLIISTLTAILPEVVTVVVCNPRGGMAL